MSYLPNPNGLRFSPNMGLGGGVMPTTLAPAPARTQYTGGLGQTIPDAYNQAGNPNNQNGQGAVVSPHGNTANWTLSELGPYPTYSGYNAGAGAPITQPGAMRGPEMNWFGGPVTGSRMLQPFQQSGFANLTNKLAAEQKPAVHPTEAVSNYWGGGFGKSDNSGWGNALGPTLETKTGANPLQAAANQPSGHTNQALPPGYGSVFGLGNGGK